MKSLVIGGSKQVGLHLVQELVRQEHEVYVLNRGKTKVEFPNGVKRLYSDRYNYDQLRSALQGHNFDYIFDTSAYLVGSPLDPHAYEEPIKIFRNLFQKTLKHFVFASSQSVYLDTDFYPITEESPVDRRTDANIKGGKDLRNYILNKLKCEEELKKAFKEEGFPMTIFRLSWVYGPENFRYSREASYLVRLEEGRKIIDVERGLSIHQAVHVDDLALAFLAALGNKRALGETYNISGDEFFTVNGFIETAAKVVGVKPKIVYLDYQTHEKLEKPISFFHSAMNARSFFMSIEKAKSHLDWKPKYDLESGLRDTYQWLRKVGRGWYKEYGGEWAGAAGAFDFSYEDEVIARYGL